MDSSAWLSGQNKEPKLISLQPAGMKKLSEAPKLVRKVRRFNPEEEDMNDPKKLAAKVRIEKQIVVVSALIEGT